MAAGVRFCAPLYHGIIAAHRSGDREEAQRRQALAMEIVAVLNRYGGLAAGKAAMASLGIGYGPVRLPLRRLDAPQRRALAADLDRLRVFDVFDVLDVSHDVAQKKEEAAI